MGEKKGSSNCGYDVIKLLKGVDSMSEGKPLLEYIDAVVERVRDLWPHNGSVENKWENCFD